MGTGLLALGSVEQRKGGFQGSPSTQVTILTMRPKNLTKSTRYSKRTPLVRNVRSSLNLSGCGCMTSGLMPCSTFILIGRLNSHHIVSSTTSPFPAIRYDRNSRERYSCQPYRLDSSKEILHFPLLSQLLSYTATPAPAPGSSPSGSSGKKRKRSETICQNWNLGSCDGDTCHYGRQHNECSECNEPHRAKD